MSDLVVLSLSSGRQQPLSLQQLQCSDLSVEKAITIRHGKWENAAQAHGLSVSLSSATLPTADSLRAIIIYYVAADDLC